MAFSKNRRLADLISADGTSFVTAAHITDGVVAAADLHSTLDLTGKTVTVATASAGDNDTTVASTAFVSTAVSNLVASAPGTLNTLNELAAALGDDASFSTTVTNSIATKLPLAGGTMTGTLNFGDGVRARFGTGNDLNIFHDGSNAFLLNVTSGGGALSLKSHDINIMDAQSHNMATFAQDGAVTLYHDNAVKLATASGGVNVTGNTMLSTGGAALQWQNGYQTITGAANSNDLTYRTYQNHIFKTASGASSTTDGAERMRIDASGKVGIGCTPARDLHLRTEGSTNGFRIQSIDEPLLFLGAAGSSGSGVDDGYFSLDAQGSNKIFMNGAASVGAVLDASGSTNSIRVPAGTTAQRPTGANGMIRYNTSDSKLETYNGMWLPVKTEAPLAFQQASTYHQKWTIAADGQSAQAGSSYSAITVNLNFEGNFTIITKWHHTYMGVGIGYKAGITNGDFTGESNDSAGPYAGGVTVDGFASSVSLMGQYHWPIAGGGGNSILYYIKHQRAGNTISTHYSTNASSATNPSHSSWSQVQTATIASTDHCKPVWGEAHSGETVPLTLLYNDISGGFNGS